MADGLTASGYSLDLDRLPGSASCRLRVIVTDGWHTAAVDSPSAFAVVEKPAVVVFLVVMKRRQKKAAVIIAVILLGYAMLCFLFLLVLIWGESLTVPAELGTAINVEEELPVPAVPSLPVVVLPQETPEEEVQDPLKITQPFPRSLP